MLHLRLRYCISGYDIATPDTTCCISGHDITSPDTTCCISGYDIASPGTIYYISRYDILHSAHEILHLRVRITYEIRHNTAHSILQFCPQSPSILEYSSCLWSPYTIKHRALIENIQRRATKFILNYLPSEVSYLDRLVHLSPFAWNFDLDKSGQKFHHSLKEHHKISIFRSFVAKCCKMRIIYPCEVCRFSVILYYKWETDWKMANFARLYYPHFTTFRN
jgi:hypothetical protein